MYDTPNPGFGRFQKHIILGAVMSGVASGIPLLNCLNCIFCLLNMAGIVLALSMYLKANPEDLITPGEGALFGLVAGAGAGLIAGLMGLVAGVLFSSLMTSLMSHVPEASKQMMIGSAGNVIMIPIYVVLYGAFGALGGFLGMQFFFKNRIRKANQ